ERQDEVSTPGPVNKDEQAGILNRPMDAPAQTMPAPKGFGDGQGGGHDSDKPGTGGMIGITGGGQGIASLKPGGTQGRSGATRERMLKEGGGNPRSEACVASGLK